MSELKLLVATHKSYIFPKADCYMPIHVGKRNSKLDLGIQGDDTGENISDKNSSFCELTALYWAWKNLDDYKYIGLVHYRRYFSGKGLQLNGNYIASEFDLLADLSQEYEVIAAKKRNYCIETVYEHYKNAHFIKDLESVREIIEQEFPDYLSSFEKVMLGKTLHLFNMFIMSKPYFEQYCDWLFRILFKLEEKIDISGYDDYQKRVFGFLAERLFNVWLVKQELRIKERKVICLDGDNLLKKAIGLLKRKYLNRR